MREVRVAWVGLLAAAVPAIAFAQAPAIPRSNGDGFDTHLFRPALDSRGFFSVNGADVPGAGNVSLGLVIDYGHGLLRVPDVGQRTAALVSDSFQGTLHVEYGIAGRALVGLSAPVVGMSGDAQPAIAGWGPQALDAQELANVAVHGKVTLLRARGALGLALAAQAGVPVSDAPRNAGADPSAWYWPSIILEERFGKNDGLRLAANVGYRGHVASGTVLGLRDGRFRDGDRVTYGIGASFRVAEAVDLVAETYGTYLLGSADASIRASNEALCGAKIFVDDSSYLTLGAGPRYTKGFEAADVRAMIGFLFEPPIGDRDGDGIRDDVDACPTQRGPSSKNPEKNGCPVDSDEDGAPDIEDACPYAKGPLTRDATTNGCPPARPSLADRDKDGFADVVDACPDDPGHAHSDPTRNGCPDVLVTEVGLTVFENILFRTASAAILPESNGILDKVAVAIEEHPELTLIEVGGHADERGAERMNLVLTQARVDAVVAALVARGIDPARLRAKGYGLYCPIEEGHDESAWRKNRRVEFVIVKTVRGATGVPLGCPNATAHGVVAAPVP